MSLVGISCEGKKLISFVDHSKYSWLMFACQYVYVCGCVTFASLPLNYGESTGAILTPEFMLPGNIWLKSQIELCFWLQKLETSRPNCGGKRAILKLNKGGLSLWNESKNESKRGTTRGKPATSSKKEGKMSPNERRARWGFCPALRFFGVPWEKGRDSSRMTKRSYIFQVNNTDRSMGERMVAN